MRIEYRDGLLFTTLKISYKGVVKQIDNIVIDTGASHSLLTQDCVDEIGIRISGEDEIVTSHGIGGKEYSLPSHCGKESRSKKPDVPWIAGHICFEVEAGQPHPFAGSGAPPEGQAP